MHTVPEFLNDGNKKVSNMTLLDNIKNVNINTTEYDGDRFSMQESRTL